MKKKVLVYLCSFFPYTDAISNVTMPLIDRLKDEYDVDIYTRSRDGKASLEEDIMGYHVYRDKVYNNNSKREKFYKESRYRVMNLDLADQKNRFLKQFYVKYLNRYSDHAWHDHINKDESEPWEYEFSEVLKLKDYSAVLTVAGHIQTMSDALRLAKEGYFSEHGIKWIAYYVDPFATYIGNLKKPDAVSFMKFETEVYQYADAVFTSPELYEDNLNYPTGQYHDKTYPIQFASMKKLNSTCKLDYIDPTRINCVYTGSFFSQELRNPEYMFRIISESNRDIQFYLVCSLMNDAAIEMKAKYLDGHDNIHFFREKPMEECQNLMAAADILLNCGNIPANQTPSKVFDYIGACKYIANFYSIDKDTSKKYLENYPWHIDIKNKEKLDLSDVKQFNEFAKKSKIELVDQTAVSRQYAEFTAEKLAGIFLKMFDLIMNQK